MNGSNKRRIFLVEDERLVLEDLAERFSERGYDVVGTARTGEEAILKIKKLEPDLVVLDIKISGELDGVEVAIVLQSHFEYLLPIVFLTGYQENGFDYLKVLSGYKYVGKPFQENALFAAVESALEEKTQFRVWNDIHQGAV